ncbi:hypothetical protein GCM10010399_35080 [Dactylosporangium fulvum]|uniref:Secreted protein n=1 Tax=Dactylosporangium fulvum TaxID=53359 RepID=A0ABY5VZ15_9ACTN|nr:hypothetical protein [Dactylosporangium fulvum]UWP82404.1 hypothetical protein Dfulv_46410 [Dactylosporangium fulvum]
MTPRTRRRGGRLATLVAVPLLILAFAGCAAPDGKGDPSSKPSSASREAWTLKFNQCLRDNGYDIKDPAAGIGAGNKNAPGAPADVMQKCGDEVGDPPPLTNEEKEAFEKEAQRALLEMANCYRKNGVNVPDPLPGEALSVPSDVPQSVVEQCGGGMAPGTLVGP